jgi:glycosyl transferase family 25
MICTRVIEGINMIGFIILIIVYFKVNNNFIDHFSNDSPNYKVYYINLDSRNDRKKQILDDFEKCQIPSNHIHRISAEKHIIGSYGCLLSHLKTLKIALKDNIDYAVIFEDDFTFRQKTDIPTLLNKTKNIKWDVCLLAGNCTSNFKKTYTQIEDDIYKIHNCQTTSGFIVKKHYISTLLNFWEKTNNGHNDNIDYSKLDHVKCNGAPGCPYTSPVDQSWKKLQEKDNWIMFNPSIGYQRASYSDITEGNTDYKV